MHNVCPVHRRDQTNVPSNTQHIYTTRLEWSAILGPITTRLPKLVWPIPHQSPKLMWQISHLFQPPSTPPHPTYHYLSLNASNWRSQQRKWISYLSKLTEHENKISSGTLLDSLQWEPT